MTLQERTYCTHCGSEIIRDFDSANRLFGKVVKCESHLCGKTFMVNSSVLYDNDEFRPQVTIREMIRPKYSEDELDKNQTLLEEFQ